MLISMPTGTSTIFGVFQAILRSPLERDGRLPYQHKDRTTPNIAQAGICTPKQIQLNEQICGAS
jgi:hypothetical protein